MQEQNLHEQIQLAGNKIQEAQEVFQEAQGSNEKLLDQAVQLLMDGERELEQAQNQAGKDATENPQFQQAYEQLHDTRHQLQEVKQNKR